MKLGALLHGRRPPISDDRGVQRRLVPPPLDFPRPVKTGSGLRRVFGRTVMPDAAWQAEWDRFARSAMFYGAAMGLLIGASRGLGLWLIQPLALPRTFLSEALAAFLGGACLWPLMPLIGTWQRARGAAGLRDAYRRVGRCACCRFDLAGLTPEADGRTVCPECGAAWLLEPLGVGADRGGP